MDDKATQRNTFTQLVLQRPIATSFPGFSPTRPGNEVGPIEATAHGDGACTGCATDFLCHET